MDGFNFDSDEALQKLVDILAGSPGLRKFSCRNQTGGRKVGFKMSPVSKSVTAINLAATETVIVTATSQNCSANITFVQDRDPVDSDDEQ